MPKEKRRMETFEAARANARGVPVFVTTKCIRVGPFAVHRCLWLWVVSHAETGLRIPRIEAESQDQAIRAAEAMAAAADWSAIKKSPDPAKPMIGLDLSVFVAARDAALAVLDGER